MDDKLKLLLEQIKLEKSDYSFFESANLDKIIGSKNKKKYRFLISTVNQLPVELYEKVLNLLPLAFPTLDELSLEINPVNLKIEYLKDYFHYFLKKYSNGVSLEIFENNKLNLINNKLLITINNKAEKIKLSQFKKQLLSEFKNYGFGEIDLDFEIDHETSEKLQKEIDADLKKTFSEIKETTKPKLKIILGNEIKSKPITIDNIIGEEDNVTVEGYVFAVDLFESVKSAFKIITLKITDFNDSIYAKIFTRSAEEFEKLKSALTTDKWFLIKGYVKNDQFSKELVLNCRDIVEIQKPDNVAKDTSEIKRVELHTHTQMSSMDGLIPADKLVKRAAKMGHKAIAITDKNGMQAFPTVHKTIKALNKDKEDNDKIKPIYGLEIAMVDDAVDVVIRPTNSNLLETTYVVFDFETTGLNAGGLDSIIEIGAVKICNGEIVDTYSQLIDPKRKLSAKITEITKITDDMLKGMDEEEGAIKKFIDWYGELPLVAHNAKFDISFLEMALRKYGLGTLNNTIIDTLELSRVIDSTSARHSLSALVKRYQVPFDETAHHRADYDAKATALVFHQMLLKLSNQNFELISDLEKLVSSEEIHKFGRTYHINMLAKNREGLKNMFRIFSFASTDYFYKSPRIPRSVLETYREGLLIGSGCYESEIFLEARSKSDEELSNLINFYDYVEIQSPDSYTHLLSSGNFENENQLFEHLKKIIRVTKDAGKIIVATGDVHHLYDDDKIFRKIIVNQKIPGGGRHQLARYGLDNIPSQYFKTTNEMIDSFQFLNDSKLINEIVIENTNRIAEMIDFVDVIIDTKGIPFSPKIENSEQIVKDMVYEKAMNIYGQDLPLIISDRIEQELKGIIGGGFDVIYLIAQKLVKKSNDDGYLVGSRGSVGSSFVAYLMGITEVNALPAHYVCPQCQYSEFEDEQGGYNLKTSSGYDLPDKNCPKCGTKFNKEGQDMPFATFLGFNADKVPDIDLNFSGDYQSKAHDYTKELFGPDNVFRAGTFGTVAEKTAYGFVKGYLDEQGVIKKAAEIDRLVLGVAGVKRTTGQHPGGIVVIPDYMEVFDFTPYQYPADDVNSPWKTTHFDYHPMEEEILKLDILGHDDPTVLRMLQDLSGIDVTTLPFDDEKVLSLLSSTEALGVTKEAIMCPIGTLGLPELGTRFVLNLLEETKPKTFSGLVKISGLSHGTDVWAGNASELIKNNIVPFDEVIGCRDDIMTYLINQGLEPLKSFKIMEFVRKGLASKIPDVWAEHVAAMEEVGIPKWYIDSCHKIKYMFPKAHAVAYVMSALRVAWFKVHKPLYYYATYFSIRAVDFDIEVMIKGYDEIKKKIIQIEAKGYDATNKENDILDVLKIALEATARGITFKNIDVEKSDSVKFLISDDEKSLIPPFRTIDGLGDIVAKKVVEEREKGKFLSIEDLQKRGKISSTTIEKMTLMGILDNMDESSQLSLF